MTSVLSSTRLPCGNRVLDLAHTHVMGLLNVTPDSFSDGGRYSHLDAALRHAEGMVLAGATLIDVRSLAEFSSGNAPGSVNIPLNELGHRLNEISRETPVVVGCASGTRSGMAKLLLKKNGFKQVYNVGAWHNFIS